MSEIIRKYKAEIAEYCIKNDLSMSTLLSSGCSEGRSDVFVLAPIDPARAKLGLADHIPSRITLKIYVEDGTLRFEQTEFTRLYLGRESEVLVAEAAMA